VFVCRRGSPGRTGLPGAPDLVRPSLEDDIRKLKEVGIRCTAGDRRSIRFGYSVYCTVNRLAPNWDSDAEYSRKIQAVADCFRRFDDECGGGSLS
jgi:hypothetical protein